MIAFSTNRDVSELFARIYRVPLSIWKEDRPALRRALRRSRGNACISPLSRGGVALRTSSGKRERVRRNERQRDVPASRPHEDNPESTRTDVKKAGPALEMVDESSPGLLLIRLIRRRTEQFRHPTAPHHAKEADCIRPTSGQKADADCSAVAAGRDGSRDGDVAGSARASGQAPLSVGPIVGGVIRAARAYIRSSVIESTQPSIWTVSSTSKSLRTRCLIERRSSAIVTTFSVSDRPAGTIHAYS